jgi:hypothetical protein
MIESEVQKWPATTTLLLLRIVMIKARRKAGRRENAATFTQLNC